MSDGPASHRATNELVVSLLTRAGKIGGEILDMGAGSGYLSRLLSDERARHGLAGGKGLSACDIEGGSFSAEGVRFTRCNVDEGLPYPDAAFDAVAAIEVMEHTRAPYRVLRELARVLRPGGALIFSVPNVGHMLSRVTFALSGHYHMFPSPSTKAENAGRLSGHVAPLPFQYWHYGLRTAGFSDIRLFSDRAKKGAAAWAIVLWPILKLSTGLHLRRLAQREPALFDETAEIARQSNSWTALTSRSLVFQAQRK
ncbi:MAG TPA: class I SAM-dependent methyltransferase [Xanthobacteraceae bacterium]